jgi:hypothetical protein
VPGHLNDIALSLAIGAFCFGEFDDQLARPSDEDCVLDVSGLVEVTPNGFYDEGLDLVCRDPTDVPGVFGSALQQGGR